MIRISLGKFQNALRKILSEYHCYFHENTRETPITQIILDITGEVDNISERRETVISRRNKFSCDYHKAEDGIVYCSHPDNSATIKFPLCFNCKVYLDWEKGEDE